MKGFSISNLVCFCLLCTFAPSLASANDNLKEILRESNWDGIIGTWVDRDSQGAAIKTTYSWKLKDRVIEVVTKEAGKESVALIGVNAKTNEVFQMGVASDGSSSLGSWNFKKDGMAVLGMAYTAGDGSEGSLEIRLHLDDKDSMTITIVLPQPIEIEMVRVDKKNQRR
ncbi:MAG: hypothetical protein P8J33_07715 [Pirellulaceae bacterium]|nr:hypothetical protein [Pirellulaceae bacterium]